MTKIVLNETGSFKDSLFKHKIRKTTKETFSYTHQNVQTTFATLLMAHFKQLLACSQALLFNLKLSLSWHDLLLINFWLI